jgi:hypothetical protein
VKIDILDILLALIIAIVLCVVFATGASANDDIVDVSWKGVNYQIPESVYNFKNNFNWFGFGDANDARTNISFTKFYIEQRNNGIDINTLTFADFKKFAEDNGMPTPSDITSSDYDQYVANIGKNLDVAYESQTIKVVTGKNAEGNVITEPYDSADFSGLTPSGSEGVNVAQDQIGAFNAYYNDVYSLAPGTGGAEMLGRLEQSYANQAQQAATMADVGFQQAAMQQASTVKQITDQVRGERMARLRAGMSESQIANQDMQMLMTNVNTLNQNAQMLNDQRLQAQIGMNTAQDQAYMDFLAQANQRGQVGSAMAASDAGDTYQQTIKQMSTLYGADPSKWTASQWTQTSNRVATGNPAGNVTK